MDQSQSLYNSYSFVNKSGREQRYCKLATIINNRISLDQQGLDVLDQYDYLAIITLEGTFERMPTFINHQNGQQINFALNAIWISKYPIYSSRLKRYVITLRIGVNDQLSLGVAHCFCSLISNVIVIGGYQKVNMRYITMPSRYIKQNPNQAQNTANLKFKISGLVGLSQNNQIPQPRQNYDKFVTILQQQGIQRAQLDMIYPVITGYEIPSNLNSVTMSYLMAYIQDLVQKQVGNQIVLVHGPIVEEYTNLLAQQYNRQSLFKPLLAESQIQVDEGFEQYLNAIETYHSKCKQYLGNQSQPDLENKLKNIRYETEQQNIFKNNSYYSAKISKHIDRKQTEIMSLNEQFNDTYNLNLLKSQSNKSLESVKKSRGATKEAISQQLDKLIRRYNEKARGNNSQKLLSQFLQVFVPTMYAQAGSGQTDNQLDKLTKQNQKLQQQLNKLQGKTTAKTADKSSKSKCCSIM